MEKTMEKIVALAKARGFVYPGSEIYGGLANTWDYGNLGVELKNNVKKAWWQKFVQESPYNVGVDCAILMNPQTWVASGHLGGFSDPLMDCKECHERFRADKLIEDWADENKFDLGGSVDGWTQEQMKNFIDEHEINCPTCGKHNFTEIRQFNLMFKTFQGVTEDAKNTVYLRPERKYRLVSVRLVSLSEMKLHRVTSHSVPENLNRWNLNSSASREQTWSGLHIGDSTASTGYRSWESRKMKCVQEIILRKNYASTAREQRILNSYSHSAGASFGVLPTEQITI